MTSATETASTERLLTVAQVARMANCSPDTVWRHVRKGALAIVRVGPTHRIRVRLKDARLYIGSS